MKSSGTLLNLLMHEKFVVNEIVVVDGVSLFNIEFPANEFLSCNQDDNSNVPSPIPFIVK